MTHSLMKIMKQLHQQHPKSTSVIVKVRSDSCTYLEYLVDMKAGQFNRYRCGLLHGRLGTTSHQCLHWGWCPMFNEAKEKGTPLATEHWDVRE